jgi:hypothetical protein
MIDRENDGRFIDIIPDLACDSAIEERKKHGRMALHNSRAV